MSSQSVTTVKRRALLIGCPDGSLKAVPKDLETMERILRAHDFNCTIVPNATKSEIIKSLTKIAHCTSSGDAIVIYYSGHGGLIRESTAVNSGRSIQFLIPYDFRKTTKEDFRGITDAQLSLYLRRITDKTDNVTLILDCCHAARLARLPGTVKTIDRQYYREILGHVQKMLQSGILDPDSAHHERNPKLLTLAAAAQNESAYEQPFGRGEQRSVLTEALERVLGSHSNLDRTVQPTISWRSVMLRVKDRLKITCPQQFPQIEGDDLRLTFSLERAGLNGALPLKVSEDGAVLQGGELHGIRSGDTYRVFSAVEESTDSSRVIAEATVLRVGPTQAKVTLHKYPHYDFQQHSSGMKALPKRRKVGRLPVAVWHWPSLEKVKEQINSSPFLCFVDEKERAPFAIVQHTVSTVDLWSKEADEFILMGQWEHSKKDQDKMLAECVEKMESMARSRHLFAVAKQTESKDIAKYISVELGTVRGGEKSASGPQGLVVKEGEKIYIEIRNNGLKTVFISIFDLCAESVSLLSTASPSGHELQQGEAYVYGKRDYFGDLVGAQTTWPLGTPRQSTRLFEKIVVIVTSTRLGMDLRCLETRSGSVARDDQTNNQIDEAGFSEFLSDIFFDNTTRTIERDQQQEPVQFGMRWASFELRREP